MQKSFRLSRIPYDGKADAFSGKGAALYPGRWNEEGTACVYTAETLSLGILEQCVHFGDEAPDEFTGYSVIIPAALIEAVDLSRFPDDWRRHPHLTQAFGTAWVKARSAVALRVPSAVNPREFNFILNPAHKAFAELEISESFPVPIDQRLR